MRRDDPYEILGIGRNATQEEAKRRFRILALQYHPDRNPGDRTAEARFKEIEDAWSRLEHVLPRSAVPLEIPEGATEAEIEDAYVKWLLDPRNAPAGEPAEVPPPAHEGEDARVWSTVAAEGVPAVRDPERLRDWRRVKIERRRRLGLEGIRAEQAARLLDSHPNAFLALKIVQQHWPAFCLYDAILWRAHAARPGKQESSSRALVIVGAAVVDRAGCEGALRDPLASVEMAQANLGVIAPYVEFGGAVIAREKLAVDIYFLRENIVELAAGLPGQERRRGEGTGLTPR